MNPVSKKGVTHEAAKKRFMKMVDKDGPSSPVRSDNCWLWMGARDQKGYPRFKYLGKSMYANRMNFLFAGAKLGYERKVVSLCQVRACVNPSHHVLGTNTDAIAMGVRGRIGLGMQWIYRDVVKKGEATPKQIAEWHELSEQVVEAIVKEELEALI